MSIKCKCGQSRPCFNFEGEKPEYCGKCKEPGMIDIKNKKCKCGKSKPHFNFKGKKPEYCIRCKEPDMINVCSKKCNCGKSQPSFNFEGKIFKLVFEINLNLKPIFFKTIIIFFK